MRISDVPKNNVAKAIEYYRQSKSDGTWGHDAAHSLLHLQDDPDELIAALAKERDDGDARPTPGKGEPA